MPRPEPPVVAFLVERTPDVLVAMTGIIRSGHAFLPLDPDQPDDRLGYLLADSGAVAVVAGPGRRTRADDLVRGLPEPVPVLALPTAASPAAPSRSAYPAPMDALYVVYTSGSTGTPKGVVVEHRNMRPLLDRSIERFGLGPDTTVLHVLSHTFDFGIWELLATMCAGGTVHVPERHPALALHTVPDVLERDGVDVLNATPSFFRSLVGLGRPMPTLRTVHLGGEELTGDLLLAARPLLHDDCVIHNGYGPTETTVTATLYTVPHDRRWEPGARVPIGRPVAAGEVRVVNDAMAAVPPGVVGELVVSGAGVARGYLGRPELTAERFGVDERTGARTYRTGDRVFRDPDGELVYLGRLDQQVKLNGYRIELGEVEGALRTHPAVLAAAADVRGDPDHRHLVGWVVLDAADTGTTGTTGIEDVAGDVRAWLRTRLPAAMVPAVLVPVSAIPSTPHGKIDRGALAETASGRTGTAPRTPVERGVADVFGEVLAEPVSIDDDFFALGGHSMLATDVVARLRDRFEVDLPVSAVFDGPTVACLAARIEELRGRPGTTSPDVDRAPDAGGAVDLEDAYARVGDMSDAEVERLLGALEREP